MLVDRGLVITKGDLMKFTQVCIYSLLIVVVLTTESDASYRDKMQTAREQRDQQIRKDHTKLENLTQKLQNDLDLAQDTSSSAQQIKGRQINDTLTKWVTELGLVGVFSEPKNTKNSILTFRKEGYSQEASGKLRDLESIVRRRITELKQVVTSTGAYVKAEDLLINEDLALYLDSYVLPVIVKAVELATAHEQALQEQREQQKQASLRKQNAALSNPNKRGFVPLSELM